MDKLDNKIIFITRHPNIPERRSGIFYDIFPFRKK